MSLERGVPLYFFHTNNISYFSSLSFQQLLRIGFDDDTNPQDVKLLIQLIVDLCNPTKITRGLKSAPPPSPSISDSCGFSSGGVSSSSLTASQLISSTTRIKNTKNNNRGKSSIKVFILGFTPTNFFAPFKKVPAKNFFPKSLRIAKYCLRLCT